MPSIDPFYAVNIAYVSSHTHMHFWYLLPTTPLRRPVRMPYVTPNVGRIVTGDHKPGSPTLGDVGCQSEPAIRQVTYAINKCSYRTAATRLRWDYGMCCNCTIAGLMPDQL